MAHHILKTDPDVFEETWTRKKNFEIRFDDRGYEVGDTLTLVETQFSGAEMMNGKPLVYTGRECDRQIDYILRGPLYGLSGGWVVMAVSPLIDDVFIHKINDIVSKVYLQDIQPEDIFPEVEAVFGELR